MSEIEEIYHRCLKGVATQAEIMLFRQWAEVEENHELASKLLEDAFKNSEGSLDMPNASAQLIMEAILNAEKNVEIYSKPIAHRTHLVGREWFRYAAAILVIFAIAAYIFTSKQHAETPVIVQELNKEPGQNKAILTLSNGRQIILDDSKNENISDGNISIQKAEGVVKYNAAFTSETNIVNYNSMATPRGGQYQLILPDGSKVWLNSASSIKYPTVFTAKERVVELNGEAYFAIKENKKTPFIVKTEKANVAVLGTEFNINSFEDEPDFSTTLISGSVKISLGNNAKIITPGQQAMLSKSRPDIFTINNNVDVNQVIAWQRGIFAFKGANLDIIARQLTRWYDIEVIVGAENKKINFSGGITKKTPLKTVLKVLGANGIRYNWENDVITLYSN